MGKNTESHYLQRELYELVQQDSSIFEFLQRGSLDGIWYWDIEAPENEWMSPGFWELLGFDPAQKEHLAKEWQDLINPEDLEVALSNFTKHCADPNHPYDQTVRYRHKDGSTVWVRCRGIAIRNDKGQPTRLLGAHTDITELKRTEEVLKQKTLELEETNKSLKGVERELKKASKGLEQKVEERTRQLLDSEKSLQTMIERAPDSIVYVDRDGSIELVNQRTEEIFGYDRGELVGQPLELLIPERFRNQHRQHLIGFFKEPRVRPMGSGLELCGRRKDGSEFPFEVSLSFMELEKGIMGCATIRDITLRKGAQEKLQKTQEELLDLNRHLIQAQEEERRRISLELHDQLGQELALLSIRIEQLKQKAPESQAQLGEQLQELGEKSKEIASRVQTLSHQLHPSQLVHLGLVAASRSLCHEVSESTEIQIDFSHLDVSRSIPQEVSTCLYRVLQESLTNVVKHSGAKTAQVELAGSPSEIQLQILDSGVGFDPESTGSRGGLGLISMRERLSLLGGELSIAVPVQIRVLDFPWIGKLPMPTED
jgi:PAS domain S-box-containing protein